MRGGKYLAHDDPQPTLVRKAVCLRTIPAYLLVSVVYDRPRRIDVEDCPKEETADA